MRNFKESEEYLNYFFLRQGLDTYQNLLEGLCSKNGRYSEIYLVDKKGDINLNRRAKDGLPPLMLVQFFEGVNEEDINTHNSFIERSLLFLEDHLGDFSLSISKDIEGGWFKYEFKHLSYKPLNT